MMKSDPHLVPVKPTLWNEWACPQCGTASPRAVGVVFPGVHVLGDFACTNCGCEFMADLPVGFAVDHAIAITKKELSKVKELVPGSDGKFELAGFGWHQGWNDRINEKFNAEYESNMSHFIRDIRKDLGAPDKERVMMMHETKRPGGYAGV